MVSLVEQAFCCSNGFAKASHRSQVDQKSGGGRGFFFKDHHTPQNQGRPFL